MSNRLKSVHHHGPGNCRFKTEHQPAGGDYRCTPSDGKCIADPECTVAQAKDNLLAALGKTATPSNKTTDAHIYAGTGTRYFDKHNNPVDDPSLDECSGTITACKLRFGESEELSFGGFPGTSLIRS